MMQTARLVLVPFLAALLLSGCGSLKFEPMAQFASFFRLDSRDGGHAGREAIAGVLVYDPAPVQAVAGMPAPRLAPAVPVLAAAPAPTGPRQAGPRQAGPMQVGEASWYGPGFDGQPTASGEIFDEDAMTAAHPSLPLMSVVRVTNLDNGRSALLRVNDRGPLEDRRVIDVSRGAAEQLGFLADGTAPVRVQVVEMPPAALPTALARLDLGPLPTQRY